MIPLSGNGKYQLCKRRREAEVHTGSKKRELRSMKRDAESKKVSIRKQKV